MSARDGVGTLQLSAHQVRTWRTRSVNRRIFSAMLSVGGVVLVVKVAALAKDVVTASYFGTSDAMDAFLIAFVLPTFAINVIAGSLEAAVVPVYVGVRDADGPEAAKQLLSSVLVTSTALLVAMGVVLLIIGPLLLPALGATFVGEKLAMTRRLFFMLIPLVVVSGSGIVLSSALNANERFLWPAATPIISSALMLALLFAKGPQWGIYALVIGLVGGRVVEGLVLVWRLRAMDLLDWKAWRIRHPGVGQVLRSFLPVAAGAAVMSNSPLVDLRERGRTHVRREAGGRRAECRRARRRHGDLPAFRQDGCRGGLDRGSAHAPHVRRSHSRCRHHRCAAHHRVLRPAR
jgi:putative peptidoglycan lipid II flippase